MFTSSAQSRHWMFKSESELNHKREMANVHFIQENSNGRRSTSKDFFLSVQEEKVLYKHYENLLISFCNKFKPPMPKHVIGCSVQYFKRFYLNHSVMDYHPKDILATCAYLATKVEEFNVSISQFVGNVRGDREKATDIILDHELLVMQKMDFELSVYLPLRPVEGFLIDIKTRYPQLFDPELLRPSILDFLEKIQTTDACFLFTPSQIGLAAVAYGAMKFDESIDDYMRGILFVNMPDKYSKMKNAIEAMFVMVTNIPSLAKEPSRTNLEKKLERCRNQTNNPGSSAYKRKLNEMLDEDDAEPSVKYSKLLECEKSIMKENEQNLGVTFINK